MNCHDREKLFLYVHQMLGPAEAEEVRLHLALCADCQEAVSEYQKLDAALDEWSAPEPSLWFDARLRARMAASEKEESGFLGFGRLRVLAVSLLSVILIVTGFITFREHRAQESARSVASRSLPVANPAASQPVGTTEAQVHSLQAAEELKMDENLSVLEDYDMLANFDVLSELPQAKDN